MNTSDWTGIARLAGNRMVEMKQKKKYNEMNECKQNTFRQNARRWRLTSEQTISALSNWSY